MTDAPLPSIADPRLSSCGGILTVHDLPKAGEKKRWTPLYKAIVAAAINNKLLTPQEACDRYCMTAAELKRWIERLETQGIHGLAADNFQLEKLEELPPLIADPLSNGVRHLTQNQLRLVSLLIHRAPAIVSREDVYSFLYADRRPAKTKILDIMICKIRRQLGHGAIETIWGRGWQWKGVQ